jgi:signal transduction histidine kinase/CheY-like chemotaxis protein
LNDAFHRHHADIAELVLDGPKNLPLIVACANAVCHCQMFGDSCNPQKEYDLQQVQWITGLSGQDIEEVSTAVLKKYDTVADLFEGNGGTAELYFSAVSRATKELSDLYCDLAEKAVENQRFHEELEKKNEQLREIQRLDAIGRLAGGVAHGFNNLLTVISGHVELAKAGLDQPENLKMDLRQIEEAASKAASLTSQLLAFGRQQLLQPEIVSLNQVISSLKQSLMEIVGARPNSNLIMDLDPAAGEVNVDPKQLAQVVEKLVTNAVDSMPGGGRVRLQSGSRIIGETNLEKYEGLNPGCYSVLSVSDSGTGIDFDTKEKIFEPFFTTKKTGRIADGLGLATVYGTIKQSDGNIFVSTFPEEGTTFHIYLPTVENKKVVSIGDRDMKPVMNKGILVVEDEESILKLIERALQVQGFDVFGANSPKIADEVFTGNQDSIGLLLTDVVMPGESGMDLYARFKQQSPDLKVVFMSGYSEEAVQEKRHLDPEALFIQKPFTPGQLGQEIRKILGEPDDLPSAADLC